MQFKVPQFLDIEDKIFGPFTFSEFAYLAGGAGLCYVLYKALGFWLGAIPIILVGGFSAALVFYKPNGKPFINLIESALKYTAQSKLYVWKRKPVNNTSMKPITTVTEKPPIPSNKLTNSKLQDLAWSLDVLDIKKRDYGN